MQIPKVTRDETIALIHEKYERAPTHDEFIALREFEDHNGGLPFKKNWYDQSPYGLEVFRILSLFRETGDPKYLGDAGRLLNNPILFESLEELEKYGIKDTEAMNPPKQETSEAPKRDLQATAQAALALLEEMEKETEYKKKKSQPSK